MLEPAGYTDSASGRLEPTTTQRNDWSEIPAKSWARRDLKADAPTRIW